MKLIWLNDVHDIQQVRDFVAQYRDNDLVQWRIRHNLAPSKAEVSQEAFWQALVACLLTTQQRSGPESAVARFITTEPFPLAYALCEPQRNLQHFAKEVLTTFGGLRRTNVLAAEIAVNFRQFTAGLWEQTRQVLETLRLCDTVSNERRAAHFVAEQYKGFGPKQSRNLLQLLGLTRYEIPIDSRSTKWLNDFGFPLQVAAATLSDPHYYELIMDGIQQLCAQSDIYPCVLDAAIFVSFDGEA